MSACAKDRSLCGFPSLLSRFFWGCHLQSQSPWSLESWKIPEVMGTPLLKSQSGARTPFPAARWCRCGCPPAWATGSRKNQGVPARERGVKARPPHTQPLADWWLPWAPGSAVLLLAGNYLSQLCVAKGRNIRTTTAWGILPSIPSAPGWATVTRWPLVAPGSIKSGKMTEYENKPPRLLSKEPWKTLNEGREQWLRGWGSVAFEPQLCHLLAVLPWASYLIDLGFCFPSIKWDNNSLNSVGFHKWGFNELMHVQGM